MSEAAPGLPDSAAFVSPGRAALAVALRAAIDATMTTPGASDADLERAAGLVAEAVRSLVGDSPDARGPGYHPRSHDDYLPRSPVVGGASPLSPGTFEWEIVADDAVGFSGCAGLWATKCADKRLIEFFSRMPPHYAAMMTHSLREDELECNRFVNLMIENRPR